MRRVAVYGTHLKNEDQHYEEMVVIEIFVIEIFAIEIFVIEVVVQENVQVTASFCFMTIQVYHISILNNFEQNFNIFIY